MHQRQKFGEYQSAVTGDIAETSGRTDGLTHGQTRAKHSLGRQRLKTLSQIHNKEQSIVGWLECRRPGGVALGKIDSLMNTRHKG